MVEGGGGGRGDAVDKAREEFFSEAQELIDTLGRDLLLLDASLKKGRVEAEVINDVFRGVHTLKGLSGLFGATRISVLSHQFEDALDDLRLGRMELTTAILDLLFQAVALYSRLLAVEKGDAVEPVQEVEELLVALGHIAAPRTGSTAGVVAQYDLDPGLFGVLTEYEEHRLRATIQQGLKLYRIRVRFALSTIDTALEDLKAKARPHGEIITYLPTGSPVDSEAIELEILMASHSRLEPLRDAVQGPNASIEEVPRRPTAAPQPPVGSVQSGRGSTADGSKAPFQKNADGAIATVARASDDPDLSVVDRPEPALTGPGLRGQSRASASGHDPAPSAGEVSLRSVSQTVRVDIRKLDRLMTIVGDLAIVRTAMARLTERARGGTTGPREMATELQRLSRTLERHLAQMQGGILEVRMVTLGQSFEKLARIVRQISRELDKEVNLVVTGAETEIDKLIVEELSDPLMHMIRNAIDHGIERRADRLRVGKPAVGTIALNAFQKGNHVVIELEDDGAGMDSNALLSAAIRKGIVTAEEARELTAREVFGLVFMPGFTTKEVATDLSGRGVGLDVAKTNIGKLGGVVDIASDVGIGTKMTITLPITLAIINVLLVDLAGQLFGIPISTVEEAIALEEKHVRAIESREVLSVRGASLPICRLDRLFESKRGRPVGRSFVVIVRVAERRLGLVVDALVGQQDIVIKPLGKSLKTVRGFAGATELGDQRVALILDVAALIEEVIAPAETRFLVAAEDSSRRAAGVRRA
jgi:two-component system chemotaxis sensor kinase CheA